MVGLFLIWSNSFIALDFLVASSDRLDWVALTVGRFAPALAICGTWCFGFRRRDSLALMRAHPVRLLACSLLMVPGYNLALAYGQQHGVAAPIASLTTTLVPLFVMLLAATFLSERLTRRRVGGFLISAAGMALIAWTRRHEAGGTYPWLIAITALAPLCWSVFSVLSKPIVRAGSPLVWTYLATSLGGLWVLPLLAGPSGRRIASLDIPGWFALLYLSIPCTVLGFAVWTWLLKQLPASSVGFSVFLNPPLTTTSKFLLSVLFPATFVFTILPGEWIGGVVTLVGLFVAVVDRSTTIAARNRG